MERERSEKVTNQELLNRILTPPTVAVLSFLDPSTVEHSLDNMLLFNRFMDHIGLPPTDAMLRGALLHDIGKIGMERLIHAKDLQKKEIQILQKHPLLGVKLVTEVFKPGEVDLQFFAHHERKNGKGYPLGLSGDNIPVHIQAFSIIDAFSAATSDRAYQDARTPESALDSIHDFVEKGWYDRNLFEIFAANRVVWGDHIKQREDAFGYFQGLSYKP